MSPQEKFKQLNKEYIATYIVNIANTMVLYYVGIGQNELRQFWQEVEDIANHNKIKDAE